MATVRGFWLYGATSLRPKQCAGFGDWWRVEVRRVADVGGGGVRGSTLRTALHTICIRLQNGFCESHTLRLVS